MSTECHFYIEIHAPAGLAGIEPHLKLCALELEAHVSGFNGQVILRCGDERVEFAMDPSTTDST